MLSVANIIRKVSWEPAGTLVTEGCRGKGGYPDSKQAWRKRFMERYAPNGQRFAVAGRETL